MRIRLHRCHHNINKHYLQETYPHAEKSIILTPNIAGEDKEMMWGLINIQLVTVPAPRNLQSF